MKVLQAILTSVFLIYVPTTHSLPTLSNQGKVEVQGALTLHTSQQRTLGPGMSHIWNLSLEQGQYAVVEVLQKGIDVAVRILDPTGNRKAGFDSPTGTSGTEKASWITNSAGIWRVEIEPLEAQQAGDYEIKLAILREATATDRQLVEADSLSNLATNYFAKAQYAEAEPLYRRCVIIQESALGPDHPDLANSLYNLAKINHTRGKYLEAELLYKRALAIREKSLGPEHLEVATSLNGLAALYFNQGKYSEAELLVKRSLTIREKALGLEDPVVAQSLNNLAALSLYQGKHGEAEPLFQRALAIYEKRLGPHHPEFANTLNNLAGLYMEQRKYGEAERLFKRSLSIKEKKFGPEHLDVANSLHNLSGLYRFQGRYAEGEPLAKRALDIEMKALGPDHPKLAANLINLAFFYSHDRRFAEAESLMLRAIEIREKNNVSIAGGLANLTAIKILQGKYAEAAAIEQKLLASEEKRLGPNHPGLAQTLARLAHTLFLADPHQVDMALPFIERAVGIYDSTGQDPVWRINAHAWRAQMRKQKGDFGGAVADLAEALSSTEKLRPQVGAGEETQAAFWEQYVDLFNRMVAWQLEAGHLEPALEYAERGRARVMLDQLAAGQIDLRNSIPENLRAPLLNRETAAKARMAEYQQRLTLLRSRKDLSDEQKKRENETLKDSLRAAEQDYQQVYEEIKYTSPLWHNLLTAAGQPVMLATIQEQLIPENGLMLIYQIGKQGSHLFVIPPASHKPEAITLQVSENLAAALGIEAGSLTSTALQKILLGQGKNGSAGGLLRQLSSRNAETASFNSILKKLWQVLIPATLWPRLVECTEVIIIPDGVLHLLPFEALVVDDLRQTRYWLDEGPAIRYAPSATTLYNLEQRAETRPSPSNGQAVVLSLSDPIFDPQKVAWAQQEQKSKEPTASLGDTDSLSVSFALRNSFERAGGVLLRLPGTARETEKISKAFNKNRVTTLMRLDANEAKLRTELPGKRYLHLATHGLVDQQRSTLFAALALTPPPAATEVAENDGFLQLYEIYELKLPECELAVLSACESNFGRYFEGEGIFALSRGFLAAGARRVIASHWALDDLSTAELISAFFRQIARDEKAGEKKIDYVRALRDAKRTVRNQKQWAAPCDWAPFILTGKR